MEGSQKHINFLEKFISKYYMKQPKWVRTFTYVVFAVLLVYAIFRLIGGEFSARGRILEESESGLRPAKHFDIQVSDKFFGTNSRGFYYVILDPLRYYKLLLRGTLKLTINKEEIVFHSQNVGFKRLEQQFDDIIIKPVQHIGYLNRPINNEEFLSDFFLPNANAATDRKAHDRLFISSIYLKSGLVWAKEGFLEFHCNTQVLKLLERELPAGLLPLVSGKKILLGEEYYFSIPPYCNRESTGKVKLLIKEGGFFKQIFSAHSYLENFEVSLQGSYGQKFTLSGDKGSRMDLVLFSQYDLVLWEKRDIEAVKEQLQADFIAKGFRIILKSSPLGYRAQTNALFGGESVSFITLQEALQICKRHHIPIKTIQYKRNLRSGNPFEIQLGGSAGFNNASEIPPEKISRILNADTEVEFIRLLR